MLKLIGSEGKSVRVGEAAFQFNSLEDVGRLLSDNSIDWFVDDEGCAVITSLSFRLWVHAIPNDQGFYFNTCWPVMDDVSELELLRFVNTYNLVFPMVQFSTDEARSEIRGHYAFYTPNGLSEAEFLAAARQFTKIFKDAIKDEDNTITEPWCDATLLCSGTEVHTLH